MGITKKLLILDDNLALAQSQKKLLEMVGYSTEIFSDHDDFLAFCREHEDVGCAILDYSLAGELTGIDVARRLLELGSDFPLFLMTGFATPEIEKEAQEVGMSQIIQKPLRFVEFRKLLEAYDLHPAPQ